jgi:hypothetical protein
MKTKFFGLILAGLILVSGSAQAALLIANGGTLTTIGAQSNTPFDLTGTTGLTSASPMTFFSSSTPGPFGLSLTGGPAVVTFEYLGSEAGFINSFTAGANSFANDGSTAIHATFANVTPAGLLDFILTSSGGGSATNGGPVSANMAYSIAAFTGNSAIVLFDDTGSGHDFDDLAVKISVSAVPLPAAAWLLISAVLGLVSFSRIRRSGAQTA